MAAPLLPRKSVNNWNGINVDPGESRDIDLAVSESYSGMTLRIPLHVRRGQEDGPVVFVSAALHGDEINGTGAVRSLLMAPEFEIIRGSVILIPVLNLLAFDRHSRYLPDRRDLNRCFPGTSKGSLASRMARVVFTEIVARSDFGIDLHTAALRRTNYPNVRGNMSIPAVREIAQAFGSELIVNGVGPKSSLRREGTAAGCPTIIMEGGEVWKVEPSIVEASVRGICNVLRHLKMMEGEPVTPDYQVVIENTKWVRAEAGGFLQFHVKPGDIVKKGQPISTNADLLGHEQSVVTAPFDSVVIGMTTIPAVSPGEPICHLGQLPDGIDPTSLRHQRQQVDGLESRLVDELASNVMVVDRPPNADSADNTLPQ